jgi:hypothetical protein
MASQFPSFTQPNDGPEASSHGTVGGENDKVRSPFAFLTAQATPHVF